MIKQRSETVPNAMQPVFAAIVALTDEFCRNHLNDEYAQMCRELTAALARKRPSPIARGKPETWACGVVYALGTVNFLFDRSQTPHVRADELCAAFGVSKSSGANKGKLIRDMYDMMPLDPNWTLPSRMDQNPMAWFIMVDGFIVDARSMPREVQEIAYQKKLIPYIPDDSETR